MRGYILPYLRENDTRRFYLSHEILKELFLEEANNVLNTLLTKKALDSKLKQFYIT